VRLPLPRFASHPAVFVALAVLHLYLGGGHVLALLEPGWTATDVWKGLGAAAGTYYFLALAYPRARA
jgi:hypothetical protein